MEDKYTIQDVAEYQLIIAENQQAIFDAIKDLAVSVNGLDIDLTRMKYEVEAARSKAEESCSMIEQLDL
jgi:hypothetical protein